jgi:hypothetical protein
MASANGEHPRENSIRRPAPPHLAPRPPKKAETKAEKAPERAPKTFK